MSRVGKPFQLDGKSCWRAWPPVSTNLSCVSALVVSRNSSRGKVLAESVLTGKVRAVLFHVLAAENISQINFCVFGF
jgi:hypothetical protein